MENLSLLSISLILLGGLILGYGILVLAFAVYGSKRINVISFLCILALGLFVCIKSGELTVFNLKTINGEYRVLAKLRFLTIMSKSKIKTIDGINVESEEEFRVIARVKCSTLESYNTCIDKFNKKEKEIISNSNQTNEVISVVSL